MKRWKDMDEMITCIPVVSLNVLYPEALRFSTAFPHQAYLIFNIITTDLLQVFVLRMCHIFWLQDVYNYRCLAISR
jgi:hypothetical protein